MPQSYPQSPLYARRLIAVILIAVLTVAAAGWAGNIPGHAQGDPPWDVRAAITTQQIEAHLSALAEEIGMRPAGSEAEALAADYVDQQLSAWGYDVVRQPFAVEIGSDALNSQNVIAAWGTAAADIAAPPPGAIIVGAHMDSVATGTGADDNGSGLAVLLTVAETLATQYPDQLADHPLIFIAFGAEEIGLRGSQYYVDQLDPAALADLRLMVNVDTVGAGDYFYAYAATTDGGEDCEVEFARGETWARDLALDTAAALEIDARTSPPESWDGFTGSWSDHAPFAAHGVTVLYLERWNWGAGDNPCWGQETESQDYLHTADDLLANVPLANIEPVAETLAATLLRIISEDIAP